MPFRSIAQTLPGNDPAWLMLSEHASIREGRIGVFAKPIAKFRQQPRDSCAGIPRIKFVAKAIGQLAPDAEVVVEVRDIGNGPSVLKEYFCRP